MHRVPTVARRGSLLLTVILFIACDGFGDRATGPRLAHGASGLNALGGAVWQALVAADTARLERLRLSEYEHNELVWPEQPAALEAGATANLDYWWRNIERRNRAALGRLLPRHVDSPLEFSHAECRGEPRAFDTFRALTDCRLLVRDGKGAVREVRAFRQVVERNRRYKVVRYDAG